MDWTVLENLGYRCADGSYSASFNVAKATGVHSPTYFLLCRCICDDERAVARARVGVPRSPRCPSCATKLAAGSDPSEKRTCQRCGKPVKYKRTKYCSNSCAGKTYSLDEERYMLNLDAYPASVAIDKFILRARQANWPKRSRSDISRKMQRLGLTFGYEETHFSRQGFCDLLEINRWRGKKLAQLGMPFKGKRLRLATKDLRDWLTWNQNKVIAFPYFDGCNQESLQFLLGQALFTQYQRWLRKDLVDRLDKQPKPIAIDGLPYGSVGQAARASFYSRGALRRIANGETKESDVSAAWIETELSS